MYRRKYFLGALDVIWKSCKKSNESTIAIRLNQKYYLYFTSTDLAEQFQNKKVYALFKEGSEWFHTFEDGCYIAKL